MAQLSLADIITRAVTDLKEKFASLVNGVVSVAQGGTGKGSHTSNSVLVGDGTNAVKNVASASGALYATAANGAPQFGTLPVAQGGTGATTAALARTNLDAAQSNGASGTLKAAEDDIDSLESDVDDLEADVDDLEASLAYVESTTATANHAIGDYFMLGNVLMRATAAIAAGETITTSNATPATVQGQIDTLRDSVTWELLTTKTNVQSHSLDVSLPEDCVEVLILISTGLSIYAPITYINNHPLLYMSSGYYISNSNYKASTVQITATGSGLGYAVSIEGGQAIAADYEIYVKKRV